jgi:hypothetical protein
MATKYWVGRAPAVAQVSTAEVTAYDAGTTYAIIVGTSPFTHTISVIGSGGTVTTVAAALVVAWNASTHPYCTGITASNSSGNFILTADTAGVPFTVATSETGAGGTIGDFAATVACSGPNDASVAINWSDGSLPANDDTVIFRDNAINVCWGLEGVTATGLIVQVEQSYTGKIGLNAAALATSADGDTVTTTVPEYRKHYMQMDMLSLDVGYHGGAGSPSGSTRIKLDNDKAGASTTTIYNTASSSAESSKPAVRLKAAHASADVYVRYAPGGVGIASDVPGETSTVGVVSVSDTTTASRVYVGAGTTLTTFTQTGGTNVLNAAATVTTVNVLGGTLTSEGNYTVTTANVLSGTYYSNHIKTAAASITTLNCKGGTTSTKQTNAARTFTTVNLFRGCTLAGDDDVVTITTLNEPDGPYSMTVS